MVLVMLKWRYNALQNPVNMENIFPKKSKTRDSSHCIGVETSKQFENIDSLKRKFRVSGLGRDHLLGAGRISDEVTLGKTTTHPNTYIAFQNVVEAWKMPC